MWSRRRLLQVVPSSFALVTVGGCRTTRGPTPSDTDSAVEPDPSDSGDSGTAPDPESCAVTEDDIEGPFYRSDAPERDDLVEEGDDGVLLVLSGRVLTAEECAPLPGAVVDLWQAAPDGTYDNTSEQMRYRGRVRTDAAGRWSVRTLEPGRYLNGSQYRPAHIHVKIWVEGEERLTTQLYFPGDPYNASDPWYDPDLEIERTGADTADFEFVV
jgi:protocatechuate 3,4-dioxygenase beta subunit